MVLSDLPKEIMNPIIQEDIEAIISSNCVDWKKFENKAVLITGASGMLPSYMALTLLQLNKEYGINVDVLALVRNREKAERIFGDVSRDRHLHYIVQDVSESIEYEDKIDFIIHGASQASPKYYGVDPVGTAKANVIGTFNLLELARKKEVESFLFFSTSGVYGKFESEDLELKETLTGSVDPLQINSCYFESKRMGENLCVDFHYQYGVPAKIIRIFHTLGPNMDIEDGRAFSDFCKCVIKGENIVLKSDGSARRTFCYITDAIKAYFIVLLHGESGEAYNVGSTLQEVSMRELADSLVKLYPEKGLRVIYDIDPLSKTYSKMKNPVNRILPDIAKLKKLGWNEEIDYRTAFRRVIQAKESI